MRNRTLAGAGFVVVLAFGALSGDRRAAEAQPQPAPKSGRDNFIHAGSYIVSRDMITHIEKRKNGVLQIHVLGQHEVAASVSGEPAKAFVQEITGKGR